MTEGQTIVLERKLTWGGLLTIASILVTAGINWGITQSSISSANDDITALRNELRTEVQTIKDDLSGLKENRYTDNARMVRVETLLNEILEEVKSKR